MAPVIGIFVTGASSTGKTTLCEALKKRLEDSGLTVYHVTEVARTVMREQGFTREHVDTIEMQKAIMLAQIAAEARCIESMRQNSNQLSRRPLVLLCDRCAIDPVVYATMHLSPIVVQTLTENSSFRSALQRYRGSTPEAVIGGTSAEFDLVIRPTVIVTDGVMEWKGTDDGVRSLYDPWVVTAVFRRVLRELNIPYLELGENIKDLRQRVEWAIDVADLRQYVE